MKLSIVATLYQSAPYIAEFHRRACATAEKLVGDDYEIILVNDGSPDHSLEIATAITAANQNTLVVDLSRNFGHHKAMMTGLSYATADIVFLIDSDLEEDPEWLLLFAQRMEQEECDVVYGFQENRKGRMFERLSGQCFYLGFKLLTGLALQENIVTARLMARRYVNALLRHEEREVFMAGLWHITGFKQNGYPVIKHNTSETTYAFGKKFALLINSVTSFSNAPLISIFYIGITISLLAALYTTYLIINRLVFSQILSGWTSVMASVWLLGGLIISFIGVIGIYLSKIYSETKRRPYTIVKQVYGRNGRHERCDLVRDCELLHRQT